MVNLLVNGSFDRGGGDKTVLVVPTDDEPYRTERGENLNPMGWTTWMLHGGPVGHDPDNEIGWAQPESKPIPKAPPYLDPPRVREGAGAFQMFTVWRIHWGGLMQSVRVEPGKKLALSFQAHAWSSQDDDPRTSEGVGAAAGYWREGETERDDQRNFTFLCGVKLHKNVQLRPGGEPLLDRNPFAGDVLWGTGAHIYNGYGPVPRLEFEVPGDVEWVTVYLCQKVLWAFKHCDGYMDSAMLEYVAGEPEPVPVPAGTLCVTHGSKAGRHTLLPGDVVPQARMLRDAGARLPGVKGVGDLGYFPLLKALDPAITTVARMYLPNDEGLSYVVEDPDYPLDQAARNLMDPILKLTDLISELRDSVDYWEVANEPAGGGVPTDAYIRIAEVMRRCIAIANSEGLRIGIFSFSAGTPEWLDMLAICETGVFAEAVAGGHILALHEGVFGTDQLIDECWGDLIPGAPSVPPGAGCLVGRFKYLKLAMQLTDQPCPPIVISEVYYGGGYGNVESDEQIMARIRWADGLYRADPDILFAAPFTWGPYGGNGWSKSDYGFISAPLVEYAISIKDEPNARHGEEPQPPPLADGRPREPYERTYVVLDPTRLDRTEMERIVDGFWDIGQYVTFGPSYDDAMLHAGLEYPDGHTSVRCIVYGWPDDKCPDLVAFRNRWYPRAALEFRPVPGAAAPPALYVEPAVGVHDEPGGEWVAGQGLARGCTVVPVVVRETPVALDFRHLHGSGTEMFVVARINWGYAGGDGTMPPPDRLDAHCAAVAETIRRNGDSGVDGWQLWNEPNNRGEHPPGFELTPGYVVGAYNRVFGQIGAGARLSPPPVDPYFGPGSDNRAWNTRMLDDIAGAGFLVTHAGKSQTNDPSSIWSDGMFGDEPLRWQYLNSKTLYTWMAQVPERFKSLPIMMGEVNPQHRTEIGGAVGWTPGNKGWVEELMRFVRDWNVGNPMQPVRYVCFYRWGFDLWALGQDQGILDQIRREGMRGGRA